MRGLLDIAHFALLLFAQFLYGTAIILVLLVNFKDSEEVLSVYGVFRSPLELLNKLVVNLLIEMDVDFPH